MTRALLLLLAFVLCWPDAAGAARVVIIRKNPPEVRDYRGDCRPGRDPSDPHCCADRLAACNIMCKDDYNANGDMFAHRRCEERCREDLRRCQGGR